MEARRGAEKASNGDFSAVSRASTGLTRTRTNASAYNRRVEDDKAPWFSEYVRRQLEDMLYGSLDLYNDGLIINTTLDLDQQESAVIWADRRKSDTPHVEFLTERRLPDGLKAALAASKFHRGLCLMPSTPRGGVRQDYR